MRWGSSVTHERHVYWCLVCDVKWWSASDQSTCSGCNIPYLPTTDTLKPSKILPLKKKKKPEQLRII